MLYFKILIIDIAEVRKGINLVDYMHMTDFPPFSRKGDNFCNFLLLSCIYQSRSTLKEKNLLPVGANSFISE